MAKSTSPPENAAPPKLTCCREPALKWTVPPENLALPKSTMPPENVAPSKLTLPPENLAPAKRTSPPENLAPPKLTVPPENVAPAKLTMPPENSAPPKLTCRRRTWRREVDRAAGELGAGEADRAAGELGAAEVAAVEDNAREVEVQALPGHRRAIFEVRGDDPDDGVADFAAGPEGKPLRLGSILARVGLVGHAQIGAQHIDAGLPVLRPVIGQARHGVHPGQPDGRRLITAQLLGRRGEPLVQRPGALLRERPVQLLALPSSCCSGYPGWLRGGRNTAQPRVPIRVRTPTLAAMIAAAT